MECARVASLGRPRAEQRGARRAVCRPPALFVGRLPDAQCALPPRRRAPPVGRRAAVACAAAGPAPVRPRMEKAVVFDMDGTLTVSNIDFKTMRERTGIPTGDLFTVMERWESPARIQAAMAVILEMEADARSRLQLMPGLEPLLSHLVSRGVRLALVTRNTPEAVSAFFGVLGGGWRSRFEVVLTREFAFVKPDRRLLLHVAAEMGLSPCELLMVGDSTEDVECGNAAGAATCLILGAGNETAAPAAVAPVGTVPTFAVASLVELHAALAAPRARVHGNHGLAFQNSGLESQNHGLESVTAAGAPAPGIAFLDSLFTLGLIRAAACSYPRMGGAAGGLAASTRPADCVLHLSCGDGGTTKLMASQGLRVIGVDGRPGAVSAAAARGLESVVVPVGMGGGVMPGGLQRAIELLPRGGLGGGDARFDAAVFYRESWAQAVSAGASDCEGGGMLPWATADSAREIWRALRPGGSLCVACPTGIGASETAADVLRAAGFTVLSAVESPLDASPAGSRNDAGRRSDAGVWLVVTAERPGGGSFATVQSWAI